jgi:hypothetical protein
MKKSPKDDDTHKTKPPQQQSLQKSKSLKEDTKTIPQKKSKPKLLKPIRNQQNNQEQKTKKTSNSKSKNNQKQNEKTSKNQQQ